MEENLHLRIFLKSIIYCLLEIRAKIEMSLTAATSVRKEQPIHSVWNRKKGNYEIIFLNILINIK